MGRLTGRKPDEASLRALDTALEFSSRLTVTLNPLNIFRPERREHDYIQNDGARGLSAKKYSSRDWLLLGIVLVAAVAIRAWLITHTEVMARDGVGLVHYARQLETEPWREVLRGNAHPPLYPLAILLVSFVLKPFWTAGLTSLMLLRWLLHF